MTGSASPGPLLHGFVKIIGDGRCGSKIRVDPWLFGAIILEKHSGGTSAPDFVDPARLDSSNG
jgi:hypothetical protein